MGAKHFLNKKRQSKQNIDKSILENIKSKYILEQIFDNLSNDKKLIIIKCNKSLRNKLGIKKIDYKKLSEIEIEIIPDKEKEGKFINISEEDKSYYHIFFDNNNEEIKSTILSKNHNINNIKVIIDYQVKSLKKLFEKCKCIESVNFKKFYRNNIEDMSNLFFECYFVEKINLSNCNTKNLIDMSGMFFRCS